MLSVYPLAYTAEVDALACELEWATKLAVAAGRLARDYQLAGVAVEHKAGNEPVTEADRQASDLIVAGLSAAFPQDLIVSEEALDGVATRPSADRVWFVDPVDGTQDFVEGKEGYACLIGLAIQGQPRLGVIYQPIGDRLWYATFGQGAYLTQGIQTSRILCSAVQDLSQARLVSASYPSRRVQQMKKEWGIRDERRVGSVGVKVGLIAMGDRDIYLSASSRSKAWDTCAAHIILAEAGGKLTDLWGQPLKFDRDDLSNREGLLASNGLLHKEAVKRVAALIPRPLPT